MFYVSSDPWGIFKMTEAEYDEACRMERVKEWADGMQGYDGWWDQNGKWAKIVDGVVVTEGQEEGWLPDDAWREDGQRHWAVHDENGKYVCYVSSADSERGWGIFCDK